MSEAICPHCPHCRRQNLKYRHQCQKCGLSWDSRLERPVQCTYCKSPYWDREVLEYTHNCNRCGKTWGDTKEYPIRCAGCRSPSWNRNTTQYQHQCKRCNRTWGSEVEEPVRCTYCKSLAWRNVPDKLSYQIYFHVNENGRYKRGIDGRAEMRLAQSLCLCGQQYNRKLKKCPACDRRGAVRFVSRVLTRAELLEMAQKKAAKEIDYVVQGVRLAGLPEIHAYRKIEGEKLEGAVPASGV